MGYIACLAADCYGGGSIHGNWLAIYDVEAQFVMIFFDT